MKRGDHIEIIKISRWGGRTPSGKRGILLKRTFLAYENKNCRWDVLIDGIIINLQERTLVQIVSPV